jgi:hypothetical protein
VSESDLYGQIAIEATRLDHRAWRNNIGVARYKRNDQIYVVRYGIPGPGGADMIGYTKRIITLDMVGSAVAIFTGAECKVGKRKAEDDQSKFLEAIRNAGGIAGVCRSAQDYRQLVGAEE